MSGNEARLADYPSWAVEITSLLPTAGLFALSGNVRDVYLSPELRTLEMRRLLTEILNEFGITEVAVIRAAGEFRGDLEKLWTSAASRDQRSVVEAPVEMIGGLARMLGGGGVGRALIVLDGSRAVTRPDDLTEEESRMFRDVRRAIDDQEPGPGPRFNPMVWVSEAAHDVPAWLCGGNPRARTLSVPLPNASHRDVLAGRILERAAAEAPERIERAREQLVDQTDGLPLRAITQITTLARTRGDLLEGLDDAVRMYRLGVLDNPWKQAYLTDRIRDEIRQGAEGRLQSRVKGQNLAVNKALDVLVRSITGLRSAHAGSRSGKPRGVLFFAGPTGVGKTELAKGLTQLLFGDDGSMIRFDMSEFASPHAVERFVGAPPGYVGFSQGGELTNAVRQKPFCLLLFDEIEKADHLLLDRFLQILDDGRLTDGRGETTYFTETVIVFTSNLGIYDTVVDPMSGAIIRRELAVDPTAGYEALADSVSQHVREYFTSVVGRPELLNRIGDNIVIFDFIRSDVGREILQGMTRNVIEVFEREFGAKLRLESAAVAQLEDACLSPQNLLMGGRGIGNMIESALVDPLARWSFEHDGMESEVVVEGVVLQGRRYELVIPG